MEKMIKYSNDDVTVVWKPHLCIHSAKCVHGSPNVFKPKEKPWVKIDAATSEEIINTVKNCPSGALSYYLNEIGALEEENANKSKITNVEVIKNGPLMVYGTIKVAHPDGKEENRSKATAFCRCGRTGNSPFCDGSHSK